MGRLRASLGWFSRLPTTRRRSILIKGAIAALVAFVIAMGVVTAAEKGIGNSLTCGFWSNCPEGASPGVHLGETRGTGAGASVTFGQPETVTDPATGEEVPQDGTPTPVGGDEQQDAQPADPAQDPAAPEQPVPEEPAEEAPVEEAVPETPVPEEPAEEAPVEEAVPETPSGGAMEEAPAE